MIKGFTLTELLISMGVIAVLTAITLPALSHARNTSRNNKCLSNLRQIATVGSLYYIEDKNPIQLAWTTFAEETREYEIWKCPANKKPENGSYGLYLPPMIMGTGRPINNRTYFEQNNPSKTALVGDIQSFHGWRNAGYMDGHSKKVIQ